MVMISKEAARALLWEVTPHDQRDALYREWFREDQLEELARKCTEMRAAQEAMEKSRFWQGENGIIQWIKERLGHGSR